MINDQSSPQKGVGVYKTEGIIMKSADLGELDRLLTIYTSGYGKILARAISARKRDSKLRGYLEPFTHSRFLLAKSKAVDIVTDVEPIDNFRKLHRNLDSLAYAYYFSELIDKLVVAPERDDKIWALMARVFQVLNHPTPALPLVRGGSGRGESYLPKIKNLFEQKLLEFLGHPSFSIRGKLSDKEKQNYINSLVGGRIKSAEFLGKM